MNIGELSIKKTDDLGHKYNLIIQHPDMNYIGKVEVVLLDAAPVFQAKWPVERQHTPSFTFTLGILQSMQSLTFNNWFNNFYYDACFYLRENATGIAINLILNQIAIIDICNSSFIIIDMKEL